MWIKGRDNREKKRILTEGGASLLFSAQIRTITRKEREKLSLTRYPPI